MVNPLFLDCDLSRKSKLLNPSLEKPSIVEYFSVSKYFGGEKVYSFEPIPKELNINDSKYIIGGECNMWTEHAPQEKIDSKVFPRILAMSEVLWSSKEKDYQNFYQRVQNHYPKLDKLNVNYGYEKTPIKYNIKLRNNEFIISIEKGKNNMELEYKINNQSWIKYTSPFNLKESAIIITQETNTKRKNPASKEIELNYHKGLGKKVSYQIQYDNSYIGTGKNTLSNGIVGSSKNFRDGQWQGFFGKDIEVTIDLEEIKLSLIQI